MARGRGTRRRVRQLLHGMRLSCKKPAKCMKELHSTEQQRANTHRLFIKLCWQNWRQRRPRREHRTGPPAASCQCRRWGGPVATQTSPAAGQHERSHDSHICLQHGPRRAGHAGADRARGQDRRRLAWAALAGAHSSRHVRERLGHHDHDPAAHGHPRCDGACMPASTPARAP